MKMLCKNTWKRKICSILLCWCIVLMHVQIPVYTSAEENDTVQYSENAPEDEEKQLSEETFISEISDQNLSISETSESDSIVSQSEMQQVTEELFTDSAESVTESVFEPEEAAEEVTEENETENEIEYQAAQWDSENSAYMITNVEELQWYGQNGAGQNAYLANDLQIGNVFESYVDWNPIEIGGNAVFDGKNHTIELYLTSCNEEANTERIGLFTAENCTIQNLILKGSISCNVSQEDTEHTYGYVGAVSPTGCGVTFKNILSYINITNQSTAPTGGITGYLGRSDVKEAVIENCAVYADIHSNGVVGGLIGAGGNGTGQWQLTNSIFCGSVSGSEGKTGALVGCSEIDNAAGIVINNCYYPENLQGIGSTENQEVINSLTQSSAKSAEQFASGEITSLLNGGITDGGQRWYQTCGSGLPALEGATVYAHQVGEMTVYTNSATAPEILAEDETEETQTESKTEASQTESETEAPERESETDETADTEEEKITAEAVKDMIDALPEVSELDDLDEEKRDQVYLDAQKAWDAYEALAEEEQAQLTEEKEKLDGVLRYFNEPVPTTISDSNGPGYGDYGYVFTGYFSAGYNLWITAGTNGGTAIYYREGNTATGTIKYLNASGAAGDDLSNTSVAGAAGGSGTNLSYNIYMDGGKIKNIYSSASTNTGTVNIIITGGTVTGNVYTLAMNTGINKNGNRHVFSTVDVPISNYSASWQGYLKKSGSQWIGYNNPVVPSGYTMELNAGDTLTVPDDKTLTNNGTIKNHGATISGDWTFKNNGTVTCSTHSYRSSGMPYSDGNDHHCYTCYFHEDVLDTAHPQDCTFDDYGFCTICDGYKRPGMLNGTYLIELQGHLFWIADSVNATSNNKTIRASLCNDIDLNADGKNRNWIPIGKDSDTPYSGYFYGNGYTISNFHQEIKTIVTNKDNYGLFGYVNGGTITNFSISGDVTMNCTASGVKFGVIGVLYATTGKPNISKIHSSVNVTVNDTNMKGHIGGIVGAASGGGYDSCIDQCSYSGTLDFGSAQVDCGGGIVGYNGYNANIYITNCLFDGTIHSDNSITGQVGGIFGYCRTNNLRVKNCLSVGTIDVASTAKTGAIGGRYLANSATPLTNKYCQNNYFCCGNLPAFSNTTNSSETYWSIDIVDYAGYDDSFARQTTARELAHGGICWLLNGKTSSSSNIWKQTIGTDAYAKFYGNIVYGIEGEDAAYGRNDTETIKQVDGYYEIYTSTQLVIFQEFVDVGNRSAYGKLMADIDMSGIVWTPICITGLYYSADYTSGDNYPDNGYEGVFDGNGHVIKNLTVNGNSGTKETYGLFGTSSGTIKNLGIETFTFNLNEASDIRTGAIVGQNLGGTIYNCYAAYVTINANSYVKGGIAGCNYAGLIENCHTYNLTIPGTNNRFGGIVGDNRADGSTEDRQGTLQNCYTTFSTLLGSQTGVETNCAAGVSNDRFASGEITWLLNGSSAWNVLWKQTLETDKYPNFSGKAVYMTSDDYENSETPEITDGTYYIYNKQQLMAFAQLVNSGNTGIKGVMMADIDISDVTNFAIGNTNSVAFTGTFDGNGYALKIGLSGGETVAPFRYVKAAAIQNLVVDGMITATGKFAAGLIGQTVANGGETTISQCLSRVTINSSVNGDGTHGGLVGVVNSGSPCTITNCGFSGEINGSSTSDCGGMVGWTNATVKITNSYVAGQFTISSESSMTFGRNEKWYSLTNCYYLTALGGNQGATQKSSDAFQSGEVTYLLNNKKADGVWKQTINTHTSGTDTSGTSDYPVFKGLSVYQMDSSIEKGYVNYDPPEKDSSGIYEIKTADNLMAFAQYVNLGSYNANGKVMADISMASYAKQYIPIARTAMGNEISCGYTGTFDGQGHIISDISFGATMGKCSNGLFGTVYNGGVVKHVGVTNLTFDDNTADHRAAGIAGQLMYGGVIKDCFVADSTIKASSRVVGGIAAMNLGTIQNCYTKKLTLAAHPNRFGGICGDFKGNSYSNNENGKVLNCYTDYATIGSTASDNVGTTENSECGVTEARFASGEITYLLNGKTDKEVVWFQTIGTDDYPKFSGKIVHYGQKYCGENSPMVYANDDWIEPHTPQYNEDGFCTHKFTDGTVCDAYQPCTGEGTFDSPYQISNAGQLYWYAAVVNTGYQAVERNLAPYGELTKDIQVNSNVLKADGTLNTNAVDSFRVWTPIGRGEEQFKGVFNGNAYTVSGLYYDNESQHDVGFFGSCLGKVSGLVVDDIYFKAGYSVGGIAGYMRENTISDCGVKNAWIKGTVQGSYVGGIVGSSKKYGKVTHCYSGATVCGEYYVGGIVGYAEGSTTEKCYQYGTVTGEKEVGSLVGYIQSFQVYDGKQFQTLTAQITYCHSYAVENQLMIGDVGKNLPVTINHCYYLSDEETINTDGTTGKTAEQFSKGEVAWLLKGGTIGDGNSAVTDGTEVWYQKLGTDAYPTFTGDTVYCGYQDCNHPDAEYANDYLAPTAEHKYDKEPYFSWSIDYKTCKAIFMCSLDPNHTTAEVDCEITQDTSDPNKTVYTASVTMQDVTYTDTRTAENKVVSVGVSWTEMEFNYTAGKWDAVNHKYEVGSWSPTEKGGDILTVTNSGTVKLEISASYEPTEESGISGKVTVEDSDSNTNTVYLEPGQKQSLTLTLEGEMKEKETHLRIGTINLKLKESVLDLTDVAVTDYKAVIADYLADGDSILTLRLGQETLTKEMGNAIHTGIKEAGSAACKVTLLDVVTIEASAFEKCTWLKEVYLPNVTTLQDKAFYGCVGLTKVYCPKLQIVGTNDAAGESYVLGNCSALKEIILPTAVFIGSYAFGGCSALEYVELPEATTIGSHAFASCTVLENLYLPKVTYIGDAAFSNCTALKSVNAPVTTETGEK